MRVLKNDTFFLITFRSVSFTLSLLFREERPVHETRMHGERRSERGGGGGGGEKEREEEEEEEREKSGE